MSDDRHEYEPSTADPTPMHTDPPCAVCGNAKGATVHPR